MKNFNQKYGPWALVTGTTAGEKLEVTLRLNYFEAV